MSKNKQKDRDSKNNKHKSKNNEHKSQDPLPVNKPKYSSQSSQVTPSKTTKSTNPSTSASSSFLSAAVQPEQMSLDAHQHIQKYLQNYNKSSFEKEDLNATLRLSQHLRIFGLLSAVGYINQSNAQGGKVREQTVPVWGCLIGQLLNQPVNPDNNQDCKNLMEFVITMSRERPPEYMAMWRKSLILAQHWNFWARAYSEVEP